MLREGRRISLSHNELYRFEGDESISSENTQGAIDFNIIVRHGIGIDVAIMQDVQLTDDRETVVFALDDITIDGQHIDKYSTAIVSQSFFLEGRAAIARFR